jgi:hypothetical protein
MLLLVKYQAGLSPEKLAMDGEQSIRNSPKNRETLFAIIVPVIKSRVMGQSGEKSRHEFIPIFTNLSERRHH